MVSVTRFLARRRPGLSDSHAAHSGWLVGLRVKARVDLETRNFDAKLKATKLGVRLS